MAGQALTCFLLLLTVNLSFVLCDDNYFKNYYYHMNGHHKKTSGADVSATEATILSSSKYFGQLFSETDSRESTVNDDDKSDKKYTGHPVLQADYYNSFDDQYRLVMTIRIIVIVGAIAYVIIVLLIIVCCPCAGCRPKPRLGYILSNNTTTGPTEMQQPVTIESQQQFQPPYPVQPTQQQYQPSGPQFQPAVYQEFHNPPVSPPPYQEKQHY